MEGQGENVFPSSDFNFFNFVTRHFTNTLRSDVIIFQICQDSGNDVFIVGQRDVS